MKKKIILLMVLLLTFVTIPVNAKTNNFAAGETVSVTEDKDSTSFIAGDVVDVQSIIDGNSFIAGNIVSVSSSQDYMFVAGNAINVDGAFAKDAFVAGNSIIVKNSSVRDLYAAGTTIKLETDVTRNAYLAGDTIIINGMINGDVYAAGDNIQIGEKANIVGTLSYPKDSKLKIAEGAVVANKKAYKSVEYTHKITIMDSIIIPELISYVSLLLISFILLALYKKVFEKYAKTSKKPIDILKLVGIGFASIVVIPVAAFIIMLTLIGIPLSFIVLLLYGIMLYLSFIPTSYFLGNWFLKDKINNNYLILAISLLILFVLKLIPILGGLVSILVASLGMGMYMIQIKDSIKLK